MSALDLWRSLGDPLRGGFPGGSRRARGGNRAGRSCGATRRGGVSPGSRRRQGDTPRGGAGGSDNSVSWPDLAAESLAAGAKLDESDAIAEARRMISRIEALDPSDEKRDTPVTDTGNQ